MGAVRNILTPHKSSMTAFDILIYRWWRHILTGFWTRIWLFRQPRNRPHGIWIQVFISSPGSGSATLVYKSPVNHKKCTWMSKSNLHRERNKKRFRNAIHTPHNLALAIARRHRNLCYSALDMPFLIDCYCCCCCCCCNHVNIIAYEHAALHI